MSDTITRRDAFHVLDNCRFASEAEKKYAYSLMEQVASTDVKDTNDMISRQVAIDSLGKGLSKIPYMNNTDADMIRRDERICCIQEVRELPSAQPEWNNRTVACLLADLFDDNCACNFNGIDEWLPEKCKVIDACPKPGGVACWEQYLKHRAERRN